MLLSRFGHVPLCATPETAAHQSPPSLGFSRQEHWSALPFPSPLHESEKWQWSRSVVSDSSDPMDCSLPGSFVHGILQVRILEWIMLHRTLGNMCFFQFWFPGCVWPAAGLLSHMAVPCPVLAISLLVKHTEETRIERDTCTPMLIAALFTITRTRKQPRCPSADGWIRK